MIAESGGQMAPPVGTAGVQEITDADLAGKRSGFSGIVWTILISVAGAGAIVGAIAGFVRLKRNLVEKE